MLHYLPAYGQINLYCPNHAEEIASVANTDYYLFTPSGLDVIGDDIGADWTVAGIAPAAVDASNNGLTVRLFDDTTAEGTGFILESPSNSTNMLLELRSRAQTAPGGAQTVVPRLYVREIPNNAAVESWSSGIDLTGISIPTNTYFQYSSQSFSLASLDMTAGRISQFELVRNAASASDTLVGDWALLSARITFS